MTVVSPAMMASGGWFSGGVIKVNLPLLVSTAISFASTSDNSTSVSTISLSVPSATSAFTSKAMVNRVPAIKSTPSRVNAPTITLPASAKLSNGLMAAIASE